jgi:ABC-type sugar transport system substrate-binding protein
MQDVLNIDVTMVQAAGQADQFLINLEVVATQNYDGCVIEPYADFTERIFELANELELKYVFIVNAYCDDNGYYLAPTVVLDQYKDGATQIQWLYDNYKDYSPDMELDKVALIILGYSANLALAQRSDGSRDKFRELLPDNQIFESDLVTASLDMQSAYDEVATILAANPNIEYWWITGCVEDLASGAATACEEYQLKGKALVTSSGANVLPGTWDSGYEGCWVSSYAVYNYNYVVPALCGVIALIDGRATWDTLWADQRREGDSYSAYIAGDQMIEKSTYLDVQQKIMDEYGVKNA